MLFLHQRFDLVTKIVYYLQKNQEWNGILSTKSQNTPSETRLDSFTVLPGASYELYDRSKQKESAVEGQTQGFPVWTK